MAEILDTIKESIIKGDAKTAKEKVEAAIKQNIPVGDILNKGLIAGMEVVGAKFKANEFYVPEVLIAARAMNQSMALLEPYIVQAG
ncbi:MAG TPA: B12-binding domain-containing protein, partial [bacterium]|nr:B12-binding domain-containing protein [bacterium]